MALETFDVLIINLNTDDHPIFKAVSISGYGSGYGNSIEEAKADLKLNISRLLDITTRLNLEIKHTTVQSFRAKNSFKLYGLSSWTSESVVWDSIAIDTLHLF